MVGTPNRKITFQTFFYLKKQFIPQLKYLGAETMWLFKMLYKQVWKKQKKKKSFFFMLPTKSLNIVLSLKERFFFFTF